MGNARSCKRGDDCNSDMGDACRSNKGIGFSDVTHGITELANTAASIVKATRGGGCDCCNSNSEPANKVVRDPALAGMLTESQNQNSQLQAEFNKVSNTIRDQGLESKIESFEDLKRFDEKSAAALVELARKTQAMKLEGRNFGFFGLTSTGKSTIINKIIGKNVAAVGAGETTTEIERYVGAGFNLFDIPGRNDEMNYFTMEYISFWKGLTGRLIVITATLKEMTKVLSLLDAIELPYEIVVNKFDSVPSNEREAFKQKIKKEAQRFIGARNIWFISADNPGQFPDCWSKMMNYITAVN